MQILLHDADNSAVISLNNASAPTVVSGILITVLAFNRGLELNTTKSEELAHLTKCRPVKSHTFGARLTHFWSILCSHAES